MIIQKQKPWSRLSKKAKRIRIAEDVLMQLDSGKFIASGGYFNIYNVNGYSDRTQVQTLLKDESNGVRCAGCAKGAIFAAMVLETNSLTLKRSFSMVSSTMLDTKNLLEFTRNQLDLIETAYEGVVIKQTNRDLDNSPAKKEAIRFNSRYNDTEGLIKIREKCLRGIMRNIIKNEGYFIPGKTLLK